MYCKCQSDKEPDRERGIVSTVVPCCSVHICNVHCCYIVILIFNYVTIRFPLEVYWSRTSISNGFRDICVQVYLRHDVDILGLLDVIKHMTI